MVKMTPARMIVVLLILIAVLVAGVGAYVVYRPTFRQGTTAAEQEKREKSRLEHLELMERVDNATGKDKLTPQEQEELRQLRERAARRRIERGY